MDYTRPELDAEDTALACTIAINKFRSYRAPFNTAQLLIDLCKTIIRLAKEINEHRAARGIEPLEIFEV